MVRKFNYIVCLAPKQKSMVPTLPNRCQAPLRNIDIAGFIFGAWHAFKVLLSQGFFRSAWYENGTEQKKGTHPNIVFYSMDWSVPCISYEIMTF